MKLKITKNVVVDYYNQRLNEIVDRSYRSGTLIEIGEYDDFISNRGFTDVSFGNGDVIQGLPNNAYTVIRD